MRNRTASLAAALLIGLTTVAAVGDVLVLRGGSRIPIKGPILQQGTTVLVTNAEGTLLSLPATEVDLKATAAANKSGAAPAAAPAVTPVPETPAEAVRTSKGPKARVRLTDADVTHQIEPERPDEGKGVAPAAAVGRVEVVEYTHQKAGDQLIVRGSLRNPGTSTVNGVRLNVLALDETGKVLSTAPATVAGTSLDPGRTATFTATLAVGKTVVPILRFMPQWIPPSPPPEKETASPGAHGPTNESKPAAAAPASEAKPAAPPPPQPTPYGRGMLYAPPAASAPATAPADGKTGYIPGASSPENQPKTPQ